MVLFEAGSATATLTFDAINDLQAENTESFTVSISSDFNYMNPSYIVGAQNSATGTVIDVDGGDTFEFSRAAAAAGFVPDYIGADFSNREGEIGPDMSFEQNALRNDLDSDAITHTEIELIDHAGVLSNVSFLLAARTRSHSEKGPERPLGSPDHGYDGETVSPFPQSNSQTSAGIFSSC